MESSSIPRASPAPLSRPPAPSSTADCTLATSTARALSAGTSNAAIHTTSTTSTTSTTPVTLSTPSRASETVADGVTPLSQPTGQPQAHTVSLTPARLQGVQITILIIALVLLVLAASYFVPRLIRRYRSRHIKRGYPRSSPYLEPTPFVIDVEGRAAPFMHPLADFKPPISPEMNAVYSEKPVINQSDSAASIREHPTITATPYMLKRSSSSSTMKTNRTNKTNKRSTLHKARRGPPPAPIKIPRVRRSSAVPVTTPSTAEPDGQRRLSSSLSPFASPEDDETSPSAAASATTERTLGTGETGNSASMGKAIRIIANPSSASPSPTPSPSLTTPMDHMALIGTSGRSPAGSPSSIFSSASNSGGINAYPLTPISASLHGSPNLPLSTSANARRNFSQPYKGPGTPMSDTWTGRNSLGFIAIPVEQALARQRAALSRKKVKEQQASVQRRLRLGLGFGVWGKHADEENQIAAKEEDEESMVDLGLTSSLHAYRAGRAAGQEQVEYGYGYGY